LTHLDMLIYTGVYMCVCVCVYIPTYEENVWIKRCICAWPKYL